MKHINHSKNNIFDTAILIKESALNKSEVESNYINPLNQMGINTDGIVSFSLLYDSKKPSASTRKSYSAQVLTEIDKLHIKDVLVCDGEYFKTLTKQTKSEPHYGYVLPCAIPGFEHINIVLCPNYQVLFFNPDMKQKITLSLNALVQHKNGTYEGIGNSIIHSAAYPTSLYEIEQELNKLHKFGKISADIEAFSLKHYTSGIGTIAFATDKHNGCAFMCDYKPLSEPVKEAAKKVRYADQVFNKEVRLLLWKFFTTYKGKIIWHNASFDCTVLAYQLFMDNLIDQEGLLEGVKHMTSNIEDTKIIAYLATNSCAGNKLSLKDQAHEFAGNYAVDEIKDIRYIEPTKLLEYNLVDCLSTWFVYEKHYQTMVDDDQLNIYQELMLPSITTIVQMQLTGMCMDMSKVLEAEKTLTDLHDNHMQSMTSLQFVKDFEHELRLQRIAEDNKVLKSKKRTMDEVLHIKFNPNSNPQLQQLLYGKMGLPILDTTASKQPATGNKTVKKLINHTYNHEYVSFLENLIGYIKVDKILSAFIPTFKQAPKAPDGYHYLFGNFNLGGTVSARLSSSKPNLQQTPSGSDHSRLIKKCFVAPPGYLMVGLDYNSLEDYISALTTKDPAKLKVYEDGFCGHCLRAANYYRDQIPHINLDDPKSVNSIKKDYPELRQESKIPTFALTYQGTWATLVANLGFSEEKAKGIEKAYHGMYKVSDEWVQTKLNAACADGYITAAFGLRVRTPMLSKVIFDSSVTPLAAAAEGRTAGNALGQSWGLLNSRAGNEFMEKVKESKYKLDIKPTAQIHDSQYFIVKDDPELLGWMNHHLVKAVEWQEHPDIQHDTVKLGGELGIFYPDWSREVVIPNGYNSDQILDLCKKQSK